MSLSKGDYIGDPPPYEYATSRAHAQVPASSSSDLDGLDFQDIRVLNQNIESISYNTSFQQHHGRLSVPIAIPQIAIGGGLQTPMPITRCYPPLISSHGLSKRDFLKVIDTLNIALSASPPFQALNAASMGTGFVPEPITQAVSAGLGVLAGVGTAATCYLRTKKFLEKMNAEIFAPRGLKIDLVKDAEVLRMLGLSERGMLESMDALLQPPMPATIPESVPKRRLRALKSRIAELDFDVPPQENPGNILDKLSARQQARKAVKKDEKLLKKQHKADKKKHKRKAKRAEREDGESFMSRTSSEVPHPNTRPYSDLVSSDDSDSASDSSSIRSLHRKLTKTERKAAEVNQKADEKLAGASEKEVAKIEKRRREKLKDIEKDAREHERDRAKKMEKRSAKRLEKNLKREEKALKKIAKLEWLVITNLA